MMSVFGRKTGSMPYDLNAVARLRIQQFPSPFISPIAVGDPSNHTPHTLVGLRRGLAGERIANIS